MVAPAAAIRKTEGVVWIRVRSWRETWTRQPRAAPGCGSRCGSSTWSGARRISRSASPCTRPWPRRPAAAARRRPGSPSPAPLMLAFTARRPAPDGRPGSAGPRALVLRRGHRAGAAVRRQRTGLDRRERGSPRASRPSSWQRSRSGLPCSVRSPPGRDGCAHAGSASRSDSPASRPWWSAAAAGGHSVPGTLIVSRRRCPGRPARSGRDRTVGAPSPGHDGDGDAVRRPRLLRRRGRRR